MLCRAGGSDGQEAVRLAERACALTERKQPALLTTAAAAYAEIHDARYLVAALSICDAEDVAWTVIGLGSNTLVRDEGFAGLVIRLAGGFTKVSVDGASGQVVALPFVPGGTA